MISDEELQEMIETEGLDYAEPEQMIEAMAIELLAYREAERLHLQCWIKDFAEDGCYDEEGVANEIADQLSDNTEITEEILCSIPLPNRHMRVWLTGGEDREVHFEWVDK